MLFDVFICHASEDKEDLVRPLVNYLSEQNLAVWYDEFSMSVGDSLRRSIDKGLSKSRFGIVVLSPDFLKKGWAQRELDGLVARQVSGNHQIILPVWHNISVEEIMEYSPPLADTLATNSSNGIEQVCKDLLKAIKPEQSPLIIARDILIKHGVQPPLISDEWWLDLAQMAESYSIGMHNYSWTFPLPGEFERGEKRAENLAWAAMQWDWSSFAESEKINHTTHPELVLEFIQDFPGLGGICVQNPEYLACYAPQLTIPGLGGDFEAVFEEKLGALISDEKTKSMKTIDRKPPLCVKEYALRHPTFGNFHPWEIADFVVSGRMGRHNPQSLGDFEYLIWLLADDSSWMPERVKHFIAEGVAQRGLINMSRGSRLHLDGPFIEELYRVSASNKGRDFKFSKKVVQDLKQIVEWTLVDLESSTPTEIVYERMMEWGVVEAYTRHQRWIRDRRRGL
ncbi:toll/interleukin-1 receptor domain-containing protein [Sneathiella aquimaris]|uniref:toll/interleukin-1 receptor domain-containing protein n=1 Tax=Sneathiella aquimaris TaxID=2599305 RepID=UPI00146C8F74|nr:toll/interleukin-1 receptor domain-containing protein [Sneathiella aquimaris]